MKTFITEWYLGTDTYAGMDIKSESWKEAEKTASEYGVCLTGELIERYGISGESDEI